MHGVAHGDKTIASFILFFLCSLSITTFAGSGESKAPTNNFNLNLNVDSHNNHAQTANVSQASNLQNTSLQKQITTQLINLKNNITGYLRELPDLLSQYKYHIIFGTIVASYASLFALVLADDRFVKRKDIWGAWKVHIPLTELKQIPHEKLIKELMHNIQQEYILIMDPFNATGSITQFMQVLEDETNRIGRYIKIANSLQRIKLLILFPTNAATIKLAHKRMERAQFVKQLFSSWAADYKMHHHLQMKLRFLKNVKRAMSIEESLTDATTNIIF